MNAVKNGLVIAIFLVVCSWVQPVTAIYAETVNEISQQEIVDFGTVTGFFSSVYGLQKAQYIARLNEAQQQVWRNQGCWVHVTVPASNLGDVRVPCIEQGQTPWLSCKHSGTGGSSTSLAEELVRWWGESTVDLGKDVVLDCQCETANFSSTADIPVFLSDFPVNEEVHHAAAGRTLYMLDDIHRAMAVLAQKKGDKNGRIQACIACCKGSFFAENSIKLRATESGGMIAAPETEAIDVGDDNCDAVIRQIVDIANTGEEGRVGLDDHGSVILRAGYTGAFDILAKKLVEYLGEKQVYYDSEQGVQSNIKMMALMGSGVAERRYQFECISLKSEELRNIEPEPEPELELELEPASPELDLYSASKNSPDQQPDVNEASLIDKRDFSSLKLNNWGNNCWVNSVLVLLAYMFDKSGTMDSEDGEEEAITSKGKIVFSMMEMTGAFSSMGNDKVPAITDMFKCQLEIMNNLFLMGQRGNNNLNKLFNAGVPTCQHDASEFIQCMLDMLGVEKDKRFRITISGDVRSFYKGQMLVKKKPLENNSVLTINLRECQALTDIASAMLLPAGVKKLEESKGKVNGRLITPLLTAYRYKEEAGSNTQRYEADDKLVNVLANRRPWVVNEDAIIVDDRSGVLKKDCLLKNGEIIQKGVWKLPALGGEVNIPCVLNDGRKIEKGTLCRANTGEDYVLYHDGDQKFIKGIARLNYFSQIMNKYIREVTNIEAEFKSFPHITLTQKPDICLLSSEGQIMSSRAIVDGVIVGDNEQLMNKELLQIMGRYKHHDAMGVRVRVEMIVALFKLLGLEEGKDFNSDRAAVGLLTMADCIEASRCHEGESVCWSAEELCEPGGRTTTLPCSINYSWQIDEDQLEKFVVCFAMFGFSSRQQSAIKRADDCMQAFLAGGHPIQLPVIGKSEQNLQLTGRLKTLICHYGASSNGGHYIALSFHDKGLVIVHDDRVVLPLDDYIREKKYKGCDNGDYTQFLQSSGFVPYVGLYEKEVCR